MYDPEMFDKDNKILYEVRKKSATYAGCTC